MKEEKFYGILYPENCPLKRECKMELAKQLFLNPNVSVAETEKIVENIEIQLAAEILISKYQCDLWVLLDTKLTKNEISKKVNAKLRSWILTYSFPKSFELVELSMELNISRELLWATTLEVLHSENLPFEKIREFLENYGRYPNNMEYMDEWLDLYILKKAPFT